MEEMMTIVTNKHNDYFGWLGHECCLCADRVYRYPFLGWSNQLIICAECCSVNKRGLIADLVHIAAIVELHKVDPEYNGQTLVRCNVSSLEKAGKKRGKEEAKSLEAIIMMRYDFDDLKKLPVSGKTNN
jgi:hypothetical protein